VSASYPAPTTRHPADAQRLHGITNLPDATVRPWPDPLLEQFGHDPRSTYAEKFWLPVIGPSSLWLLRHVAARFDEHPAGFQLDLREAGRSIGIGTRGGANSALVHTVGRVIQFGFAQFVDDRTLLARRHLPSLTRRQLARMPADRQREHDEWAEQHEPTRPVTDMRRRARTLALSLLDLGEDAAATEHQLHRWKFHPAVAHEAVRWAIATHAERLGDALDPGPGPDADQASPPAVGPALAIRPAAAS
jgi:hypothetical protein